MNGTDGSRGAPRGIDLRVGALTGEAAIQRARPHEVKVPAEVWEGVPSTSPGDGTATYYDRPVIKEPVWIWSVPAYFYVGGAAGAAALLGAATQGRADLRNLTRACRRISAGGAMVGTAFLVYDLGRPERFLNMLRVFRPTSAMNLGSWVLSAFGAATTAAAVLDGRRTAAAAGSAAAALGLPMSTYTAVLLSDTSVPLWSATRRSLPGLFAASAVAGAASLLDAAPLSPREHAIVARFGTIGRAADLVAGWKVERDAAKVPQVDKALKSGVAGSLWTASKVLTAGALLTSLAPGRSRIKRYASAALGSAAALAVRFAVFHGGKASARDPRATFEQQRAAQAEHI